MCVHVHIPMYLYRKLCFIVFLRKLKKLISLDFLSDFFIECDWQTGVLNVRVREKNEKTYFPSCLQIDL